MNEFYLGPLNLSNIIDRTIYTAHLRLDVHISKPETALWEALKDLSLEADGKTVTREWNNPVTPDTPIWQERRNKLIPPVHSARNAGFYRAGRL